MNNGFTGFIVFFDLQFDIYSFRYFETSASCLPDLPWGEVFALIIKTCFWRLRVPKKIRLQVQMVIWKSNFCMCYLSQGSGSWWFSSQKKLNLPLKFPKDSSDALKRKEKGKEKQKHTRQDLCKTLIWSLFLFTATITFWQNKTSLLFELHVFNMTT